MREFSSERSDDGDETQSSHFSANFSSLPAPQSARTLDHPKGHELANHLTTLWLVSFFILFLFVIVIVLIFWFLP